jgi:phage/plasmid-associated DNA primase
VRLIPWEVSIPEEKREPQDAVIARLLEEGPGILRWLMEGLADWQQEPHWVATEVLMATEAYRAEQDRLATFLEERCEIGSRFSVTAGDLYNAYEEWCRESGESAVSKRELGQMLRERGFEQSRAHGGVRVWRGLRVRTTLDETIDDVDAFIADACSIVRGAETTVGDLYDAYCEWCAEHGATAMPKNQFGQMLSEKGFAQRRDRENRFWVGIQIKKNVPDPFREIDDLLDELWK